MSRQKYFFFFREYLLIVSSVSQGYTLADEEEDSQIFQHRQSRSSQSDTLESGPVESGPMKKLHVSTTALQKVNINTIIKHVKIMRKPKVEFVLTQQLTSAYTLNVNKWFSKPNRFQTCCI